MYALTKEQFSRYNITNDLEGKQDAYSLHFFCQYNNIKYRSNPDWLQGIGSETI